MAVLLVAVFALAIGTPIGAAASPRAQQYNEGATVEPAPPAAQPTPAVEAPPATEAPTAEETPAEEGQSPSGQQSEGQAGVAVESATGFLPFTGFHLAVALAAGLALAAAGLGFRRLGQQRAD